MSEIGPELVRLQIYKENTQINTIPSYFPKNSNRKIYSLTEAYNDSKIKQDESYSIIQRIDLTQPEDICPVDWRNKYKKTEVIYADINTPIADLKTYQQDGDIYFKIVEKDGYDQEKYKADLPNISRYYNKKWHIVLEQDFTTVFCKARHIKVEKIQLNLDKENHKFMLDLQNQIKINVSLINNYTTNITDTDIKREYETEYTNHLKEKGLSVIVPDEMKLYFKNKWSQMNNKLKTDYSYYESKVYYMCSSFSPYLRIGTTKDIPPAAGLDATYIYMGNPNIELWVEDQYHNVIDMDEFINVKGEVILKLIVEGRM